MMPGQTANGVVTGGSRIRGTNDQGKAEECSRIASAELCGRGILLRKGRIIAAGIALLLVGAESSMAIETILKPFSNFPNVNQIEVVQFAVFAGAMSFAILSAFWLIRERTKTTRQNRTLLRTHADLKARLERTQALLNAPDHRVVIWSSGDSQPDILGSLPVSTGAPAGDSDFLAFGAWMDVDSAKLFTRSTQNLRENAESFDLTIKTRIGSVVEAQGRTSGAHAFVRFIPLSGERAALANLEAEHTNLLETFDTVQSLFESISMPVWLRDRNGELVWANRAYAAAVDANSGIDAVEKKTHILDNNEREAVRAAHMRGEVFRARVPAIIAGDRRMLDVVDVALAHGSAGIATDVNEVENAQSRLRKTVESHARTLDQMATAVAIFDSSKHLQFYNAAFQTLWDLDPAFLDSEPDHSAILINLRTARKLPEQPEWQKWKDDLFDVYQGVEPCEHWWYLPDGRTLRVIANPHPHDGVTWIFENVTEELDLKSRYNALIQVQGETLDHLSEAVAVFAPDGNLRLFNPTFRTMWELDDGTINEGSHVSKIAQLCATRTHSPQAWENLQTTITGLADKRGSINGRMALINGGHVDYALMPLPNGQSMLTFVDVSASVEVENVLVDRNEALEQADHLKNAFIEHVSYELRSPLTNIIGFSELLGSAEIGKLNVKQSEYLDHINTSSSSLLAIVNNILDLATVDAGIMELDLSEIDVEAVVDAATDGVRDRMRERGIALDLQLPAASPQFIADENRVRQVLFNLLSNAVNHSPDGATVSLVCENDHDNVIFKVTDTGNGISEEVLDTVFKRFESHSSSQRRGGAGLGLAIVKSFVELHGGTTKLNSVKGKGTTVICRFPRNPSTASEAAE